MLPYYKCHSDQLGKGMDYVGLHHFGVYTDDPDAWVDAVQSLGAVPYTDEIVANAAPMIQAGRLRGLAVTTPQRSPLLPEVPSMEELGFKDFSYGALLVSQCPPGHLRQSWTSCAPPLTCGQFPHGSSAQLLSCRFWQDY